MELIAIVAISIGVAVLNQLHVIIQWIYNPHDHYFTGIAHSFADYFLYVGAMAQGAGGRWIFADHLFTNEPMAPTWYYWFYVTLGHLGNLIGLSPFATYNVSLLLLVVALCLVWYYVAKTIYPTNRLLRLITWVIILTTTNFSWDGKPLGQFWFSPSPVWSRLGGVPYHVFQSIIFVLLAIAISKKSRTVPPLSFLAGISNPVQTLLIVLASRNFPAAFFGGLGAWMTNEEFARQAVFTAARSWELVQAVPNTIPVLILSMGPILFFVPFGLRRVVKTHDATAMLLITWGLLSFALFLSPIPKLLQLSPVRFLHPVPYAATLAILGSEGVFHLKKKSLFLALYLVFIIPAISAQFVGRITPAQNPQLLMDTIYNHVPRPIVEALAWLKKQNQAVVLTDPAIPIEVLVPVFTGRPSFSGHPIHTLYPDVKENFRQDFFAGRMSEVRQKQFLTEHRIGYIVSSRELPAFTRVFSNDTVTIYTP